MRHLVASISVIMRWQLLCSLCHGYLTWLGILWCTQFVASVTVIRPYALASVSKQPRGCEREGGEGERTVDKTGSSWRNS